MRRERVEAGGVHPPPRATWSRLPVSAPAPAALGGARPPAGRQHDDQSRSSPGRGALPGAADLRRGRFFELDRHLDRSSGPACGRGSPPRRPGPRCGGAGGRVRPLDGWRGPRTGGGPAGAGSTAPPRPCLRAALAAGAAAARRPEGAVCALAPRSARGATRRRSRAAGGWTDCPSGGAVGRRAPACRGQGGILEGFTSNFFALSGGTVWTAGMACCRASPGGSCSTSSRIWAGVRRRPGPWRAGRWTRRTCRRSGPAAGSRSTVRWGPVARALFAAARRRYAARIRGLQVAARRTLTARDAQQPDEREGRAPPAACRRAAAGVLACPAVVSGRRRRRRARRCLRCQRCLETEKVRASAAGPLPHASAATTVPPRRRPRPPRP